MRMLQAASLDLERRRKLVCAQPQPHPLNGNEEGADWADFWRSPFLAIHVLCFGEDSYDWNWGTPTPHVGGMQPAMSWAHIGVRCEAAVWLQFSVCVWKKAKEFDDVKVSQMPTIRLEVRRFIYGLSINWRLSTT